MFALAMVARRCSMSADGAHEPRESPTHRRSGVASICRTSTVPAAKIGRKDRTSQPYPPDARDRFLRLARMRHRA
jgi:hypothetical protein